jgi:hypothetical protein
VVRYRILCCEAWPGTQLQQHIHIYRICCLDGDDVTFSPGWCWISGHPNLTSWFLSFCGVFSHGKSALTNNADLEFDRVAGAVPTRWSARRWRHWHRWFAWRPVSIYTQAREWRVVWLQYLERRWTEGVTSGLGPRWVYRRPHYRRSHYQRPH